MIIDSSALKAVPKTICHCFPVGIRHRHLETGGSLIDKDMHWDCVIHVQPHL